MNTTQTVDGLTVEETSANIYKILLAGKEYRWGKRSDASPIMLRNQKTKKFWIIGNAPDIITALGIILGDHMRIS